MSYTFGGATGDDINITAPLNYTADNTNTLVCGWFYPTTLTATRGMWGVSGTWCMEIDATTSQLRFRTNNTTDGQWTTTGGPGLTTNQWYYIAALNACENTGPAGAWRAWVGTAADPPTELTVANAVAPVGNFSGGANLAVGNTGTGTTVAFQGDIGWVSFLNTNAVGNNNPFSIATSGAISNNEALLVYNRWVLPLWLGRPQLSNMSTTALSTSFSICHFPMTLGSPVYIWSHATTLATVGGTINGATYSQNLPPREPPENWPLMAPYVRRAA